MSISNMSNGQRLFLVVMAFAVLFTMGPGSCKNTDPEKLDPAVTPGDGQVGEVVLDGYNEIRDTASEVMDTIEATGDGVEVETHDSPLPALWDVAKLMTCEDACEADDTGCMANCRALYGR